MTLDALIAEGVRLTARPPQPRAEPARWSVRAEAPGTAHLYLYDHIGWPGIDAQAVAETLRVNHTRPIQLHLNSPGGDVFAGLAIYNSLRQHGAPVDVRVEGHAASIASVIAMGGSTLRMCTASMLMVHNPHALVIGGAADMRAMADLLDQTGGVLAEVYTRRGPALDTVRAWMDATTWWPARDALRAGLIDAVDDGPIPAEALAASAAFEQSGFRRPAAPEPVPVTPHAPAARHLTEAARLLYRIAA